MDTIPLQPRPAERVDRTDTIDLALLEIVILLIAIITNTIVFWRIERLAGLLFVPYAVWVTYATILNASLWLLNAT